MPLPLCTHAFCPRFPTLLSLCHLPALPTTYLPSLSTSTTTTTSPPAHLPPGEGRTSTGGSVYVCLCCPAVSAMPMPIWEHGQVEDIMEGESVDFFTAKHVPVAGRRKGRGRLGAFLLHASSLPTPHLSLFFVGDGAGTSLQATGDDIESLEQTVTTRSDKTVTMTVDLKSDVTGIFSLPPYTCLCKTPILT